MGVFTVIDFLARVLSPTGYTCIATPAPAPHKGFSHYRLTDKDKIEWLIKKLLSEQKNVYFAIGTLREKEIEVAGVTKIRVAANIHEIKSLILDLDVGANNPKKYPSQRDAVQSLMKFCKETNLPTPIIVSSGYGIHVYWPFTQAVAADVWRPVAHKFKQLTESCGLLADPARTSDMSSVLRVPGTMNFKKAADPKPVAVLNKHPVVDTPFDALKTLIEGSLASMGVTAKPLVTSKKIDSGLGSFDIAQEPASLKEIAQQCLQVKALIEQPKTAPNPLWFHTLQLLRFCNEPMKMAHYISRPYPGYTEAETNEIMDRHEREEHGPTLCATFDSKCPGGCEGCKHRGKITTPLVLGRSLKPITEATKLVVEHGNGEETVVEIPPAPYPYVRTTSGKIAVRVKDEDGKDLPPEMIYEYDIYPIKRMFDEVEQTETYTFRHHLPKDPQREFTVPAFLLYDRHKIMETLGRSGVCPDPSTKDQVVNYMLGYIRSLQATVSADQIYNQMGWRNNNTEILIGNRCYTKDGVHLVKVNDQFKHVVEKFTQKGDIEKWKKVIMEYDVPGLEEYAFGLMMGFGQLAFKFSGYQGAVFNYNGEGGCGKSTVLRMIHSIYGAPTETAILHHDTTNAKLAMLGCYNNLPVTYDETTNIPALDLSDLTYAISNGRGKESLKQDRTLRENTSTWQLVSYGTSNGSMNQRLISFKGANSGEMFRLMERNVFKTGHFTLEQAQKAFGPLVENHGLAGGIIANWMVTHVAETQELMQQYTTEINTRAGAISSERFWVAMGAQAAFGAYIGNLLDLHSYSLENTIAHAVKVILELRGGTVAETKTPIDVLVEYMNVHIKNTLVVRCNETSVAAVLVHPVGNMVMRHEQDTHRLWVTKSAFKAWCAEKNHDVFAVINYLNAQGLMINENASKALGDNTEYLTGRLPCYMIKTDHSLMTGVPSLHVVSSTKTEAKKATT
jgi:hypothetical protein